jgi:hypothetical protein
MRSRYPRQDSMGCAVATPGIRRLGHIGIVSLAALANHFRED